MRVEWNEEDLNASLLLDGQRQREVAERVELDGDFLADRTDESGLEEAVKQVDDDGVVTHLITIPCFLRNDLNNLSSHCKNISEGEIPEAA